MNSKPYRFDDLLLAKVEHDLREKTARQQSEYKYPQAYGSLGYYMQCLIDDGCLNAKGKKIVADWIAALEHRDA